MASSHLMASSSSGTSDLTRQSSIYSLNFLGSMNIGAFLSNLESDGDASTPTISRQGSVVASNTNIDENTVDEVSTESDGGEMTLEDFLARAEAVSDEKVKAANEGIMGPETVGAMGPMRGEGRGRKRDDTMDPIEKAALRRQKRMMRNGESAGRLRDRKQAYTAELESLVIRLEEENAQLISRQEEREGKRLKQPAEQSILIPFPIMEQRKPYRRLRRTQSMEW